MAMVWEGVEQARDRLTALPGASGERLLTRLRLGTTLALLGALLLDPAAPDWMMAAVALLIYLRAQSLCLSRSAGKGRLNWARADLLMFCGVMLATGGGGSPLLVFLVFPIGILALREGVRGAFMAAAAGSMVLLFPQWAGSAPGDPADWPWTVVFIPSVLLVLVLWGRSQLGLLRQAAAMQQLHTGLAPDASPIRCLAALASALQRAAGARSCLILLAPPGDGRCMVAWSAGEAPALTDVPWPDELPPLMRRLAATDSAFYSLRRPCWQPPSFEMLEPFAEGDKEFSPAELLELDRLFGKVSLAAFALPLGQGRAARVVLLDADPLSQEIVRQLQALASQAAARLELAWARWAAGVNTGSRDAGELHDSVLQPILGMRLALEALKRKAGAGLSTDVEELIGMAGAGLKEIRRYTSGHQPVAPRVTAPPAEAAWLAELRREVCRSGGEGMRLSIPADEELALDAQAGSELVSLVRQGLSSLGSAGCTAPGSVRLRRSGSRLLLQLLGDESTARLPVLTELVQSLQQRAAGMGGSVRIRSGSEHPACVEIELPMPMTMTRGAGR